MLHVEGLAKAFGGQVVLDDISLELNPGEVALLRGPNGAGKTTLLNILTGNLPADAGHVRFATSAGAAQIQFPLSWRERLSPFSAFSPEAFSRLGLGRTWQDLRLFETLSLRDNIAAAFPDQMGENPIWSVLRRGAIRRQERQLQHKASEMLDDLGLHGRGTSSADRVSLGQAKRVAIARAVAAGARVLFLDEPLSGLDAAGVDDVLGLLERLAHEHRLSLVIVEHVFNIPRVLGLCSVVWTLEGGSLKVETPSAVRAELSQQRDESLEKWIGQLVGPQANSHCQALPGGAQLTVFSQPSTESEPPALQVQDLIIHRGRRLVIGAGGPTDDPCGFSFTLRQGEIALLQAPNGWGKTTLLETLAGVHPATRGGIRYKGQTVESLPAWRRDIELLQARDYAFPSLTVREALQLVGVERVPSHLDPYADRLVATLSGGEKQKLALVTAVEFSTRSLLLLDEPLGALDHDATLFAQSLFQQAVRDGRTLLMAVPRSFS